MYHADLRLHEGVGPDRSEQLIVRHKASSMFDEIVQYRERLRHERDTRLAPHTLVGLVEPKRPK